MPKTELKKTLIDKIDKSDLDFIEKNELYNALTALNKSEDKINRILASLSENLFKDELNEQTVKDFNGLVSIIEAERVDFSKLDYQRKKSYLRILGVEVDKDMKEPILNNLYKEYQESR